MEERMRWDKGKSIARICPKVNAKSMQFSIVFTASGDHNFRTHISGPIRSFRPPPTPSHFRDPGWGQKGGMAALFLHPAHGTQPSLPAGKAGVYSVSQGLERGLGRGL